MHFDAPVAEVGYVLTFELTVESPAWGTVPHEVKVKVLAANPPRIPPSNLRALRTNKGFRLYWDDVFDAELYEIQLEYLPDIWIPIAPNVHAAEYAITDQETGSEVTVRVVAKNSYGKGAESQPISVIIIRNVALREAAGGATPPLDPVEGATYVVSHHNITRMNDGAYDDHNDSRNGELKSEDYWGYLWAEPLYFDHVAYFTGDTFSDGGWFTSLTVKYTEDGANWVDLPVQIIPPYNFADEKQSREAYERYDISFPTVRGKGIRIHGRPGGSATFTSISELEVYGDQTRGPLVVQGLDGEAPAGGAGVLDGSYSFSATGPIVSYLWQQVSGPTVSIADQHSAVTSFDASAIEEGTVLVFSLTASDGADEATDDDVRITVTAPARGAVQTMDSAKGGLNLTWNHFGGGDYTVECCASLVAGDWQPVEGTVWPIQDTSAVVPMPMPGPAVYIRVRAD